MKTGEDFDELYNYDTSITSTNFESMGMLETFGDDIQTVLEINKNSPLRVWTMVDGDDGMYLVQGLHYVNRIYYVITTEPAQSEDEEYLIDSYDDDEEDDE
jgi:hypothetical protein